MNSLKLQLKISQSMPMPRRLYEELMMANKKRIVVMLDTQMQKRFFNVKVENF